MLIPGMCAMELMQGICMMVQGMCVIRAHTGDVCDRGDKADVCDGCSYRGCV